MDKPLSQERLSKKELKKVDDYLFSMDINCGSEITDIVEKMLEEIKRMQAIEVERNELRELIDRQHILLDNYETILNIGSC